MKDTIQKILGFERYYTPESTGEMRERGVLLRRELQTEVAALSGPISHALGVFGDDLLVEASYGTGLKSELPWGTRPTSEQPIPFRVRCNVPLSCRSTSPREMRKTGRWNRCSVRPPRI